MKRPRCPAYLDDNAKREWRRLVPILERMRVLTEADEIALGNLCQQYALMQEAQIKLKKTGLLVKTRSGSIQQSPLVAIISTTVDQVNKLCREFGLTPSSRTRIQVEPVKPAVNPIQQAILDNLRRMKPEQEAGSSKDQPKVN